MSKERVSQRLLAEFEQMRRERNGTAGMIQCAGCPDPSLVPEAQELCWRHQPTHPDAWMSYQPADPFEGYDVIGNL